jgi:agarase
MRLALLAAGVVLTIGPGWSADTLPMKNKGFFRAQKIAGRWWLIAPDGGRFISKGITTVQFEQDHIHGTNISPYGVTNKAKYGSREAWREAVARRLIGWGFNTLGAWSDEALSAIAVGGQHLAYAPTIDLGAGFVEQKKGAAWLHGVFPDVFDPEFEVAAQQRARERCAGRKDDPWLLGWFTDNELRWGADWRGKDELLTMFLASPAKTPGHEAAVNLLRDRYREVAAFNAVWHTAFSSWDGLAQAGPIKPPVMRQEVYAQNQERERHANEADPKRAAFVADCEAFVAQLAERYFRVTSEAIKAADPNHMNFGCRFAYVPPKSVVVAAAKYLDAISFNCYSADPRPVIQQYSAFGKPLIIGEFSFRGDDSGLPNTKGAGPRVKTQTERAAAFGAYVSWALGNANVVGYHWFEHADEPKEGRFDGENSNYGVVNIHDEVYGDLTRAMQEINLQAKDLHATGADSR